MLLYNGWLMTYKAYYYEAVSVCKYILSSCWLLKLTLMKGVEGGSNKIKQNTEDILEFGVREGFTMEEKVWYFIYQSFYWEGREGEGGRGPIIQRPTLGLVLNSPIACLLSFQFSWVMWADRDKTDLVGMKVPIHYSYYRDWTGSKFRHLTGCSPGSHRTPECWWQWVTVSVCYCCTNYSAQRTGQFVFSWELGIMNGPPAPPSWGVKKISLLTKICFHLIE